MNKLRRSMLALLILCLIVLRPVIIKADVATVTDSSTASIEYQQTGKLKFNLLNGSLIVIGYTGNDSIIAIPSEYVGYKVTAISDNAFINDPNLSTLIVPTGITYSDSIAPVIIEGNTEISISTGTTDVSTSTISTITNVGNLPSIGTVTCSTISSSSVTCSTSTTPSKCTSTVSIQESSITETGTASYSTSTITETGTATCESTSTSTITNTSTATCESTSTSITSHTGDSSSIIIVIMSLLFSSLIIFGVSPVGSVVISKIKSKKH